jgi:hypothetical protein
MKTGTNTCLRRPGQKQSTQDGTQMKYRNEGFVFHEYDSKARLAEAGLLSAATGKFHNGKPGLVRLAGPTIHDHATTVTGVTYNYYLTLIMCRYLASSSSGEIRIDSGRVSAAPNLPGRTQYKKSRGCSKWQPQTGPIALKGQVRSGGIWCSCYKAQTDGIQTT